MIQATEAKDEPSTKEASKLAFKAHPFGGVRAPCESSRDESRSCLFTFYLHQFLSCWHADSTMFAGSGLHLRKMSSFLVFQIPHLTAVTNSNGVWLDFLSNLSIHSSILDKPFLICWSVVEGWTRLQMSTDIAET
ncbi:N-acetyltransferase domain-containing protein [Psidium guajava]|nr:N-acetyltransferase domain-containing protein [Psidium guajava]